MQEMVYSERKKKHASLSGIVSLFLFTGFCTILFFSIRKSGTPWIGKEIKSFAIHTTEAREFSKGYSSCTHIHPPPLQTHIHWKQTTEQHKFTYSFANLFAARRWNCDGGRFFSFSFVFHSLSLDACTPQWGGMKMSFMRHRHTPPCGTISQSFAQAKVPRSFVLLCFADSISFFFRSHHLFDPI